MNFPAESILVIRMSGIGDVLWTTPFLANLRRGYPNARISYIVRSSCAQVLENNPAVDEIILFENESILWQMGFLSRLKRRHFDLSIDLVCTPATAIQSRISGARNRIGFDFRIRGKLYNHCLSVREANTGHAVGFNLFVLDYLGIPVTETGLVWTISNAEEEEADKQWFNLGFSEGHCVIGLIPTGGYPSKKWPREHFAGLASQLGREMGLHFLVFWGSEAERMDAEFIVSNGGPHVRIAPKNGLRQAAALMKKCNAVVGNDSGPTHIATALGIPVLALYGPSDYRGQGPWSSLAKVVHIDNVDEICCHKLNCPDPVCMTGLEISRVAGELADVLSDGCSQSAPF